jgi:hypothetical protein
LVERLGNGCEDFVTPRGWGRSIVVEKMATLHLIHGERAA